MTNINMENATQKKNNTAGYWDENAQGFDAIYSGKNKDFMQVALDRWLRKDIYDRIDRTVELVDQLGSNQTVIDVGTGTGRLCIPLAKHHHQVIGVDFSKDMLTLAQNNTTAAGVQDQCRFFQADLLALASQKEILGVQTANVIVSLGVWDYIEDTLKPMQDFLSYSPQMIIGSFPKAGTLRCNIRQWRYKMQNLDYPLYFYTPEQLREYGKALGAKETHIESIGELYFAWYKFQA